MNDYSSPVHQTHLANREARQKQLFHPPIASHQGGHFFNAFQGERRFTKRLHGNAHQFHGVIVCGYPVGTELTAALAAVDNCPFAAFAHPDGNRLHDAAAVGCAVARLFVYMKAGQAVGTMVAVPAARILRRTQPTADFAGKAVSTIMGFIVTFSKVLRLFSRFML